MRVTGERVFIITLDKGIYEYSLVANELIERKPREGGTKFIFGTIDEQGSCGPIDRLYWSHSMSKTTVYFLDLNTWETGWFARGALINRTVYGSWQTSAALGHYTWGFSVHATLPKAIAAGIVDSTWKLWSGCLGQLPTVDPPIRYDGTLDFKFGIVDRKNSPSACWGRNAHGGIGYSCDQFRHYKTWEAGRGAVLAAIEPFCDGYTPEEIESIGRQVFAQRTRNRF